jgi:hypothetical protein
MALKKLLTNLEQGLNAYPNHNTPSSAGGFNYGNSTTRIFDVKSFRQKSYKFGQGRTSDRPDGGFSNEPYLYSGLLSADNLPDVPNAGDASFLDSLGSGIDSATDGLIRGGLLTAVKRSAQDVIRIGKWAFDWPTGPMWLLTQMGLQRTNPKIQEKSAAEFGTAAGGFGSGIGQNNRIYNPLGINTIAQSFTNFAGLHINRSGLLPLGATNYRTEIGYNVDSTNDTKYEWQVKDTADVNMGTTIWNENRLLHLHFHLTDPENDTLNSILYEYSGGAHSIYGIGNTTLKRYDYTRGLGSKNQILKDKGIGKSSYNAALEGENYAPYIITPEDSGKQSPREKRSGIDENGRRVIYRTPDFAFNTNYIPKTNKITDFRQVKGSGYTNYQQKTTETAGRQASFVREDRVNTGDPGAVAFHRATDANGALDYRAYSGKSIDKINALDIIRTNGVLANQEYRDLVRFRIGAIDSDNPSEEDTMVFRAFLDDFSDSYNANHNSFKYNGRGEEFYTYNSFKRKLSFSFKIAAQSRHEMMPLYRKLNFLVSNVAPEYKVTRMRTPFIRLTIGSMIDRLPGVLNSVSLKWQKDYPWEIAFDGPEQEKGTRDILLLPHVLDVSVQFTPIHNFLPQKSITDSPFILSHHNNRVLQPGERWYTAGAADTLDEATINGLRKRTGISEKIEASDLVPDMNTGLIITKEEDIAKAKADAAASEEKASSENSGAADGGSSESKESKEKTNEEANSEKAKTGGQKGSGEGDEETKNPKPPPPTRSVGDRVWDVTVKLGSTMNSQQELIVPLWWHESGGRDWMGYTINCDGMPINSYGEYDVTDLGEEACRELAKEDMYFDMDYLMKSIKKGIPFGKTDKIFTKDSIIEGGTYADYMNEYY